jgi:hypothetical protein
MEQMGMTNAEMVKYLGSQSRVSEKLFRFYFTSFHRVIGIIIWNIDSNHIFVIRFNFNLHNLYLNSIKITIW